MWEGRESELLPLGNAAESDSANLDHVAELLMRTGVASEEALMILVPEAYDNHPDLQKSYPEVQLYSWHTFCLGIVGVPALRWSVSTLGPTLLVSYWLPGCCMALGLMGDSSHHANLNPWRTLPWNWLLWRALGPMADWECGAGGGLLRVL